MNKTVLYIAIILLVVSALISSIWLGFYPIAILIGIFSILFGFKLFSEVKLSLKTLLLIVIQVLILCVAFGFVYLEFGLDLIDSMTISFQTLFHVSIMKVPDIVEQTSIFKIIASLQSFIGYLLIISGVSVLIKEKE